MPGTFEAGAGSVRAILLLLILGNSTIAPALDEGPVFGPEFTFPDSSEEAFRGWYHKFMVAEAGHYRLFLDLAALYYGKEKTRDRWQKYLLAEAEIMAGMESRSDRIH